MGTESGEIWAVWRHHFETNLRDPAFRSLTSPDANPIRVHADNWSYPGCPHSGPAIDRDASHAIHTAWHTGSEGRQGVHYARKPATAEAFDPPIPIVTGNVVPVASVAVVALADGRALVGHSVGEEGNRVIGFTAVSPDSRRTNRREIPNSEGGTHPRLAVLSNGDAVAAWTQVADGVQRVRILRISEL